MMSKLSEIENRIFKLTCSIIESFYSESTSKTGCVEEEEEKKSIPIGQDLFGAY